MTPQPRILRVDLTTKRRPRRAVFFTKVPYGQAYDLGEKLMRLQQANEIRRYEVRPARKHEIAEHRDNLRRWPDALAATVLPLGVNLDA